MPQSNVINNSNAAKAVDSVVADSVQQAKAKFVPSYAGGFPDTLGNNAHFEQLTDMPVMEVPTVDKCVGFQSTPLHDPGVLGLMILAFIFMAVSYKKGYKYFSNFAHNLFSVRKRQNMFDDNTVSETQISTALILNTCLLEGIMLYVGINYAFPVLGLSAAVFKYTGIYVVLMLVFYLFQLGLYYMLGYVFGNTIDTELWIDGFKASQSLLGLALYPIVFITLLYPSWIFTMLMISTIMYFLARLLFISKGFRIFFSNLSYSVYFILYLCTVEIAPVLFVLAGAVYLSNLL